MDSAILYLFSTIAQVLAAVLALVFVFVLFKLQTLDKKLDAICTEFASFLGANFTPQVVNWQDIGAGPLFMKNYLSKYFQGITEIMLKICDERESENEMAVKRLRIIAGKSQTIDQERKKIIKHVKRLTVLGLTVIIISMILIPFAKSIESDCYIRIIIISLMIFFTSLTLFWVYKILVKSLGR